MKSQHDILTACVMMIKEEMKARGFHYTFGMSRDWSEIGTTVRMMLPNGAYGFKLLFYGETIELKTPPWHEGAPSVTLASVSISNPEFHKIVLDTITDHRERQHRYLVHKTGELSL